ncbi:MAG: cupin domain-containing protein [Gemmatimonadota bacterium]
MRICRPLLIILVSTAACSGQENGETTRSAAPPDVEVTEGDARFGYVLGPGQGEVLGTDIIKASPRSGTQGSVMISQILADGFSTGRHVHLEADELFYVVTGEGRVSLGDQEHVVTAGYVIFAPAGSEHRLRVDDGGRMEVIEFLDEPGLDEEFRAWHRRFSEDPSQLTLEELNQISRQYGTVYGSLR